jgi:ABC-type nickel/cobalt efflux system permease component RcnA
VGFGLLLIVAFSVGLAAVLIGLGLVMVSSQRFLSRFHGAGTVLTRWLPLTSSMVITLTGVALAAQALAAVGVLQ